MIERIQTFHEKGYIHRDLKPENFLFKNGTLYLIDYGLSKKYKINNPNRFNVKNKFFYVQDKTP